MKPAVAVGRELLGLFVDDLRFTVAVLGWLAVAMLQPAWAGSGMLLFLGLLAILVGSAYLAGRAHRRKAA